MREKYLSKDLLLVTQKWELSLWQRIHQMIFQSEFYIPIEKTDLHLESMNPFLLEKWRAIDFNEVSKIDNMLIFYSLVFYHVVISFTIYFRKCIVYFSSTFGKLRKSIIRIPKTWIEEILSFFVCFIRQVWMIKNPRINIAGISLLCLTLFQSIKKLEEYCSEICNFITCNRQRRHLTNQYNEKLLVMEIDWMITNGFRGNIFNRILPLLISQEVQDWKRIILMLIRKSYRILSIERQIEKLEKKKSSYQIEKFLRIFGSIFTSERLTEASQNANKSVEVNFSSLLNQMSMAVVLNKIHFFIF